MSKFNQKTTSIEDLRKAEKCLHHNYKMVGENCEIYYCPDCGYSENINDII